MDLTAGIFKERKPDFAGLKAYGFKELNGIYVYVSEVMSGEFELTVTVNAEGEVYTALIDTQTAEPYTLHLDENAVGGFVGAVRAEYARILQDIAKNCFGQGEFKGLQTAELIERVRSLYGDELVFLWERLPDAAVLRRKDTKKWYAAILSVSRKKLGLEGEGNAEIIDLKALPEKITAIVDGKRYFPGYHMNKKHWFTAVLDGSVNTDELCALIAESYALAHK